MAANQYLYSFLTYSLNSQHQQHVPAHTIDALYITLVAYTHI